MEAWGGVHDFSTIIDQQLQNLLPTILAQVGNHGNNQENIVNENVHGDVRNVIVNNDRRGCTYKEFLACNLKEYDGKGGAIGFTRWIKKMELVQDMSGCGDNKKEKYTACSFLATEPATIQKAVQLAGALTDEALRNGFIKKNLEKRGNVGEPSNDRNVRDDNKRTRTGNSFATTANPVGRENTSNVPNCATCNSYHAPGVPCRTCFNCKHPGYFAKDCKVMPRNVNPVNVRNPSPARGACYECRSTDHIRSACHRYKAVIIYHEKVVRIPLRNGEVLRVVGERPDEKVRHLRSAKAKEQKLGDFVVVRNFPKVFPDDLAGLLPI
ncbi:hypothetical protein Tco_0531219 [Tanacetum coccineum]